MLTESEASTGYTYSVADPERDPYGLFLSLLDPYEAKLFLLT
jgi:hypothetical protein